MARWSAVSFTGSVDVFMPIVAWSGPGEAGQNSASRMARHGLGDEGHQVSSRKALADCCTVELGSKALHRLAAAL